MKRQVGSADKNHHFGQVANVALIVLTVLSSLLTIAIAPLDIWDWAKEFYVRIEFGRGIQTLPQAALRPTSGLVPTYTLTPQPIATPEPLATPQLLLKHVLVPTATPRVSVQIHIVKHGEILACIAKLYYGSPDAHDELCRYNQGKEQSTLYGETDCGTLFPGDKLLIPQTLDVITVLSSRPGNTEHVTLQARVVSAPDNGYLCQN